MRKLIATFLIYTLNAYAVPPVSVDSEQSAVGNYVQNTKLPNEQATQLTQRNTRVETGNSNLLKNPSFEHMTLGFGWTISNATYSLNTTNQVEGKKALNLTPTAAMVVSQDSTINAANIAGLQGVASVKIKATGTTGLKVCPRNAGAAVTNLCVNVTADNTWKHIAIPFILGTTSNGIGIATTATGGTVIIDDAFVGTSAPFQDVSGAKLVGAVVVTGCTTYWSTTSTTFASFGTQTGCSYSTIGSASAPATNIPAIKFASLPAGDYRLEYEGTLYQTTAAKGGYYQFSDGTNTARELSQVYNSGGSIQSPTLSQTISYSTAQSNITFEVKGKTDSGGTTALYGTTVSPAVIKVYYFPPATKIYSQASQDSDWQSCTFSSLAWQGFGNVTNNLLCKRTSGDLLIKGKWTSGTTAASIGQIPLPNNWGTISVSSSILSNQLVGLGYRDISAASQLLYGLIAQPNASYLNVSNNGTAQFSVPVNGSTLMLSNETQQIMDLRIPIQNWQNYGVIVGSFAGLEKCANDYECTDTFSAQVSATGVVTNENLDWINGNCAVTLTSYYTCSYNSNLKDGVSALSSPMNCTITPTSAAYQVSNEGLSSTTQRTFELRNQLGNLAAASSTIKCQKGTQDYKPKTAKVASSIGVPTVPGITTQSVDAFSVSYGTTNATTVCSASPCSYLDQIGTAVSSITRTALGSYSLNTTRTYTKLKCSITSANTGWPVPPYTATTCANCSSLAFNTAQTNNGTTSDSFGTIVCQGTY